MSESKGLGDSLEKVFKATGVSALVEKTAEILGIEDCGCSRRRDALNEKYSYNTPLQHPPLVEQNIIDFAQGLYMVNNNLVFTRGGTTYDYKIGDRIFITEHNPNFNDFREYFRLGIISKYESKRLNNTENS